MDPSTSPGRPRKRRAINACTACRTSKVRCDGKRPCERCARNEALCVYHDAIQDPNTARIERLEADLATLKSIVDDRNAQQWYGTSSSHASTSGPLFIADAAPALVQEVPLGLVTAQATNAVTTIPNAVEKRLITWDQASLWFQRQHYFVPVFCGKRDTFGSVSGRSSFLFDTIITIGCRAEEGPSSPIYHRLQARLREHLTNILINSSVPSIEAIQAITIMAGYSENGFVMIALALRFAQQLGLPTAIDKLMARSTSRSENDEGEDQELYRLARVWHGICNLELFFSLDGGKVPGVTLRTSSRRIRVLVEHPECTNVDIRLLSQIELNIIRSNSYVSIAKQHREALMPESEGIIQATVHDTSLELSLWMEEWTSIITSKITPDSRPLALLNIQIQREWALLTLYLKALSDSGIENIALMSDFQHDMVRKAKEAAARHLRHLLQKLPPTNSSERVDYDRPAYLTTFKWTMDYVWAKCAFSVLLVLKLALLLRDPLQSVILLLRDAHTVLEELKTITTGHIAYFQILQTSIEKCELAIREHLGQQPTDTDPSEKHTAEDDFQGYAPSEFVFEWDFPGLNLRHMPLSWHDLFLDYDNVL